MRDDNGVGEGSSQYGNWRRNLTIAWVAQFLCIIGLDICLPFIPFYIRELGVTDTRQVSLWTGAIMSGCSVVAALVSPLWGVLADRRGAKLMAERAAFAGTITLVAIALAANVQQLAAIRLIQCATTGMTLAFVMLVSSRVPLSKVGFSLGLMQMGAYLAFSIGPIMGGFLTDNWGYRRTFGAAGVLPLLAGVLVFALIEDRAGPVTDAQTSKSVDRGALAILGSRSVLAVVLALSAVHMANSASRPIWPLFVESLLHKPGLANVSTGAVYGVFSAAAAIAAVLAGRLGDRVGYRSILIACGAGGSLAYVGQSLAPNVAVFTISVFFSGLFLGGLLPITNAILAHVAPKGRLSTAYGLSNLINSGGKSMGPLLGASIAVAWGTRSMFAAAAVLLALITVFFALGVDSHIGRSED